MKALQNQTEKMGNSVSSTCDTYADLYLNLPKVSNSVTRHKGNMTLIEQWAQKQQDALNLRGLVRDKNLLRLLLTEDTVRIISGTKALANDSTPVNTQLLESVNYSRAAIEKVSDSTFFSICSKIKGIADTNANALIDFGISSQLLSGYALDIAAFNSIYKKPKSERGQLKTYTTNLAKAFTTMTSYLRNTLDNLIKSNFPNSDFNTSYFYSRHTDKVPHSTDLIGTIVDKQGHPVKDAILEMLNYPAPGEITVRSTNHKGHFAYKRLTMTHSTIRVRALNFTTAEYEVNLTKDEITRLDITLIPDPAAVSIPA